MALDIDAAMDAAEAKIAESAAATQDIASNSEPISDVVEDVAVSEAVEASKSEAKARDNTGKFTKSGKSAVSPKQAAPKAIEESTPTEQVSDQVADAGAEGEQPGLEIPDAPTFEAPVFWPAELKAAAAECKTDAERALVAKFAAHDAQREEWARRTASEAKRGKEFEQRLYADMESPEDVQRHKAQLRLNGVRDEVDELHRYRAWDKVITTDPETAIQDLIRKNNLQHRFSFAEDQGHLQAPSVSDPRVETALQEAQAAKAEFAEWKANQERRERETELTMFKEGKDSAGNVRAAFVDAYAPQIAEAVKAIREQYPHMPRSEVLNHAYEFQLGEVRKLHGISYGKPVSAAQSVATKPVAKPDASKAKAAASGVTGAPANGGTVQRPRLKGDSFNDKLNSAMDNAEEQLGSR